MSGQEQQKRGWRGVDRLFRRSRSDCVNEVLQGGGRGTHDCFDVVHEILKGDEGKFSFQVSIFTQMPSRVAEWMLITDLL